MGVLIGVEKIQERIKKKRDKGIDRRLKQIMAMDVKRKVLPYLSPTQLASSRIRSLKRTQLGLQRKNLVKIKKSQFFDYKEIHRAYINGILRRCSWP